MKSRVIRCFVLLCALVLLQFATVVVLQGQSGAGVSSAANGEGCVAGDANGDGTLSILDPLYVLEHLFQEGPAPVACAGSDSSCCCDGPGPRDLVNILLDDLGPFDTLDTGANIGGVTDNDDVLQLGVDDDNREFTIYTVPKGRWLILTDWNIVTGLSRITNDTSRRCLQLVQVLDSEVTRKLTKSLNFRGVPMEHNLTTGISFAPGSEVVLRNVGDGDSPSTLGHLPLVWASSFRFTGYLVDDK